MITSLLCVVEKDGLWLLSLASRLPVVAMMEQLERQVGNCVEEQELERKHRIEKTVSHVIRVISGEVYPAVKVEEDGEDAAYDEGSDKDTLALDKLFHLLVELIRESFAYRTD